MKRTAAICVALAFSLVCFAYADYSGWDTGKWPKSWPKELEPLRKQARTFEGPTLPLLHHAIPFTKRDEFESAWPHLLKIKSRGAPIILRRGPSFWLGDKATAGVCVHTPPTGEAPIADGKNANGNWEKTIYIELIVDGEIIDLNRIPLPADTPIIDERFKDVLIGEGAAANSGPAELPAQYPHWTGDWAVSSDLRRALGFGPDEHDRSSALSSSFQLSFDTQLNDSAKQYQSYFPKHQIVATGKWHDEKQDGLMNRDCVVTIHDGDTFLWVTGFPFIGVHGGKVSYLEGVDSEHDALVLDYNTMPKHLSGHARDVETVAFQRAAKIDPDKQAQQAKPAGDRVGVEGDGDKVKQAVPDRESNSYYLYTKALSATESGVVAVPSRFKWSIETSWSGIDAQGKDLPDTRVMMRLYDPDQNFTALTAQMDLATAERLQRELADIIAKKRKNADYQYRPQLYDSSLIPTGEIKGIDRNCELIIELPVQ